MLPQWIIEKKRDGLALDAAEIRDFVAGYTRGDIPDYQAAALAMAIYFRGMDGAETFALTRAMLESGTSLDTRGIAVPKVDKHSTGGIGDKVSLILAPLAAACGVAVPMLSGRGLGLTGGTLDKLESIPGYRTDLDETAFLDIVRRCGCSIMGQTASLAPADRKLYALRDVTGTVPSIPLIAASIMSKKLAEGLDALVLDVKWGKGAFMKTLDDARRLAGALLEVGRRMGVRVCALLTRMSEPLGRAVGNALEVVESVAALRGDMCEDLRDVTLALGEQMLVLTGIARDTRDARPRLLDALASGAALRKFEGMVACHGGSTDWMRAPDALLTARIRHELRAPRGGVVCAVDAEEIGRAALLLGAGRATTADTVDHAVGMAGIRKGGERVAQGDVLAVLHANDPGRLAEALPHAECAFEIGAESPPVVSVVTEVLHG